MTHQTWISGKAIRPLFTEPVTYLCEGAHGGTSGSFLKVVHVLWYHYTMEGLGNL